MRFTVRHAGGYLRGDLYHRETADETREFLLALAAEALSTGIERVLISVHASRAIFRMERFGLSELIAIVASRPAHRIAAVADSLECRLAQQYGVVLSRLRGLNVRSFRSEAEAIAWLEGAG
jgi:hypothetical protein